MKKIDILYLGVNMGNCGYRFFGRYPEGREDYYNGFKWLLWLKEGHPELDIRIKHHGGDYNPARDTEEMSLVGNKIPYIHGQEDSFYWAKNSKMCVSYCSTMILELNGMPNLAHFIYNKRHKRFNIARKCKKNIKRYTPYNVPAFYLDPGFRNRQFCMYIDDVCKHDCSWCKGRDLEIFKPYRIPTYDLFKKKVFDVIT